MRLQNRKLKSNNNFFMNKGFTLIELLAIIIIMGIVALITVPVIKDLIDESRKNSFKNSALGIVNAANQYYLNSKLNGENFEELTFTVQEGKMISGDKELSFNGKAPVGSSYIKINKSGEVAMNITDGEFYASKDYDEVGVLVAGDESSALTREELASRIAELETLLNTKIGELNTKVDNTKNELSSKDMELSSKVDSNTKSITDMTNIDNANNIFLKNYPVGSIYKSTSSTNPSSLYGGTWSLISKNVIDTGWIDFSWTDSSYIGTTQSSYTQNKWRIKNNILYIQVGVGATAKIDTATEVEIARIPIVGNTSYDATETRVWIGAVGGSGATAGFSIKQNSTYLSISVKPHTSANDFAAFWYSTHFTVPLDEDFSFTTGSYDVEYTWKRTN